MSYLPHLLLILVAVSIGATVIAIIIAHRCRREARNTIFPVVREEEALRARWANIFTVFSTGLTLLFLGAWLFNLLIRPASSTSTETVATSFESAERVVAFTPTDVAVPRDPPIENPTAPIPSSPPPTADLSQSVIATEELIVPSATSSPASPAGTPSATSVVVMVRSSAGTPTPTSSSASAFSGQSAADLLRAAKITTTPILSSPAMQSSSAVVLVTATPPVDVLLRTSITPSQILPASASSSGRASQFPPQLGPIAFTTEFDSAENVQGRQRFPADVSRVFAIYPFSGMQNGSQFTTVWYYDDQELWRNSQIWQWGDEASSYTYINNSGEGPYRLELYVNDDLLASGSFEVQ